jgi:glyoxylase-like metal-dependent hydrolase (beta-lactamase superfamily II)
MREVRRIGRRTWLARMGSGLELGRGREGWGIMLGTEPRRALAAQGLPPAQTIPLEVSFASPTAGLVTVFMFVLVRGQEAAIVDTTVAGNADLALEGLQSVGLGWDAVRHVILTHWHPDHAGSAPDIVQSATNATIWAGEADIPNITLPRAIQPANDGDEVFGLRIVATPGHTAGHISVLDPAASTLMTGDAVFNMGGVLTASPPAFTADAAQAAASLRKLGGMGFERALVAHGPPIEEGAAAAIAALAASGVSVQDAHAAAHAVGACCAT